MDLRFNEEDKAFRAEARSWLEAELTGPFAVVRGRGGPGDEHALFEERLAWEQRLGQAGWTCVGWPKQHGGRGLGLTQQVIWFEEYARADGPGRLGHIGQGLAGPTILAFGDEDQKRRFLPGIVAGTELWSQGYSEPDAGSDLANVSTRAERLGDQWVITGQKVWTSLAHWAHWCFVLARTNPGAPRHGGMSYLLVPLQQDGIEIRPIRQVTGDSEFNEVFFDGARTDAANVVGGVDNGWKVAMGTLAFERGASTLGQQLHFENELAAIVAAARANGRIEDPVTRQRLVGAWSGLRIIALERPAHAGRDGRSRAPPLGHDRQALLGQLAPRPGQPGHGRARPVRHAGRAGRRRLPAHPDAAPVSLHPQRHHLRRLQPDPAQPHRRTGPRSATRTEGGVVTGSPPYVAGHGLLDRLGVVVTAAAGTGIGFATAKRCAEEGARLFISDVHERRLGEAAARIEADTGQRPGTVLADVTDEAQVQALFAAATDHLGGIDVLVNNAGLGGTAELVAMTDEQWDVVLDVTLNGTMRCTRTALRRMIANGGGVIVNNASVLGWRAQVGQAHYAAAKAGVMALTRAAAMEGAPHGVRVNAVAPSLAMHPFLAKVTSDELLDQLTEREAFGRAAEPWEIANVIVFLASDYSSYLTGEVISASSQHP